MRQTAAIWMGFGFRDERGSHYTGDLSEADIQRMECLERFLTGREPATATPAQREESIRRALSHALLVATDVERFARTGG